MSMRAAAADNVPLCENWNFQTMCVIKGMNENVGKSV